LLIHFEGVAFHPAGDFNPGKNSCDRWQLSHRLKGIDRVETVFLHCSIDVLTVHPAPATLDWMKHHKAGLIRGKVRRCGSFFPKATQLSA
jgi:hypothetical protein